MYYLASRIQRELLNIAYRLQVVVELNGPILWETESIRIDSSSESNRIDSNCELECTTCQQCQFTYLLYTRSSYLLNLNQQHQQDVHLSSTQIYKQPSSMSTCVHTQRTTDSEMDAAVGGKEQTNHDSIWWYRPIIHVTTVLDLLGQTVYLVQGRNA